MAIKRGEEKITSSTPIREGIVPINPLVCNTMFVIVSKMLNRLPGNKNADISIRDVGACLRLVSHISNGYGNF